MIKSYGFLFEMAIYEDFNFFGYFFLAFPGVNL